MAPRRQGASIAVRGRAFVAARCAVRGGVTCLQGPEGSQRRLVGRRHENRRLEGVLGLMGRLD